MNSIVWIIFAVVLVLVAIAGFYARAQARERTQALQALALQIGFIFLGEDWSDGEQAAQMKTALFNRGSARRFDNIMIGEYGGFSVSIFDYRYTVSSGKSSVTYTQTVAAFTQKNWLPLFELRPEGFLDRVGDLFTHKDIDFESNPDFSRRYLLRGEDPEKIRALFSPALLAYIEDLAADEKWHVEGSGTTLLFYRSAIKVDVEQIVPFRDQTAAMAQNFFKTCGAVTA